MYYACTEGDSDDGSFPASQVPYADIGVVYQLLDQHAAVRVSEDYDIDGPADVLITVRVEATEVQGLVELTTNATSGRITPRRTVGG